MVLALCSNIDPLLLIFIFILVRTIDYDACVDHACDLRVAECVDNPPPSLSYECHCREGFTGEPGPNGSGCGW